LLIKTPTLIPLLSLDP